MLRIALLSASLLLAAAGPVEARHGVVTGTTARLPVVQVPLPLEMHVEQQQCPYLEERGVSCADVEAATVWLSTDDRFTRWHEIGHLFDHQALTDHDRAVFGRLMGGKWSEELFADAYAACALQLRPRGVRRGRAIVVDWQSGYGYEPTDGQQRRVCARLRAMRPRPLMVTLPS